ncbi:hypothetical protein [Desulfuribacillus stibiiarsenatis]|uniref:hypothetical protein n=1 Tax=Desulfuribacillus stibiiarsenatis TaxID=1390249 RepID=UPI00114CE543|nr:hypothetical protein [Desulfuribacillus stibiiarsenatis]
MNQDIDFLIDLMCKIREKETNQRLWEQWLTLYPNMDEKSFVPFEKFKKQALEEKPKEVKKSDDAIIQDAESILRVKKPKKK